MLYDIKIQRARFAPLFVSIPTSMQLSIALKQFPDFFISCAYKQCETNSVDCSGGLHSDVIQHGLASVSDRKMF